MSKKAAAKSRDEMTPQEVLLAFWAAMNKWERRVIREDEKSGDVDRKSVIKERDEIIDEYCTPKRRVGSKGLSFGFPPKFDPKTEEILEIVDESPTRVVIYTQEHAGFENKRRFVMLRQGGRWSLDSFQWQLVNKKWERGII